MDDAHFDDVARAFAAPSRRGLLAILGATVVGAVVGSNEPGQALAKRKKRQQTMQERGNGRDRLFTERRKKKKKKKKKSPPPGLCGGVTCPEGRVCCPDKRCGLRCCANGRACDQSCCGPNGNDYCCDASRPMCICGGCWQAGSSQCGDPRHCCSPRQRCCGSPPFDHCCAEGWECKAGCGGNPESATCCKVGAATCCTDGHPA